MRTAFYFIDLTKKTFLLFLSFLLLKRMAVPTAKATATVCIPQ
jgi:hypothetical protein